MLGGAAINAVARAQIEMEPPPFSSREVKTQVKVQIHEAKKKQLSAYLRVINIPREESAPKSPDLGPHCGVPVQSGNGLVQRAAATLPPRHESIGIPSAND